MTRITGFYRVSYYNFVFIRNEREWQLWLCCRFSPRSNVSSIRFCFLGVSRRFSFLWSKKVNGPRFFAGGPGPKGVDVDTLCRFALGSSRFLFISFCFLSFFFYYYFYYHCYYYYYYYCHFSFPRFRLFRSSCVVSFFCGDGELITRTVFRKDEKKKLEERIIGMFVFWPSAPVGTRGLFLFQFSLRNLAERPLLAVFRSKTIQPISHWVSLIFSIQLRAVSPESTNQGQFFPFHHQQWNEIIWNSHHQPIRSRFRPKSPKNST